MKTFAAVVLVAALTTAAWAGEYRYLGRLCASFANGSCNNQTTDAGAFAIPLGAKITVYCQGFPYDGGGDTSYMLSAVSATPDGGVPGGRYGLPVAPRTLFPSSVTPVQAFTIGGNPSAALSMVPNSQGGICDVWQRDGLE